MAVWQFDVHLVPHGEAVKLVEEPFEADEVTWLDEAERERDWWAHVQPVPGYLEALDAVAPRKPSWSADLRQWGSEDGNRIDVSYDAGRVAAVLVRIDLREPDQRFIDGVAGLAQDLGCDYLTPDGTLAAGHPHCLAILLRNSPALRFVENPLAFLRRVSAGGVEDA